MTSVARTCSIENCDRPFSAKGFCSWHYQRSRLGTDMDRPHGPLKTNQGNCSYGDCTRPQTAKNLCTMHYKRASKGSDMDAPHVSEIWREKPPKEPKPKRSQHPSVCVAPGCGSKSEQMGMCLLHYRRNWAGVPLDKPILERRFTGRSCLVSSCINAAQAERGLCKWHSNWSGKYRFSVAQVVHILNSPFQCEICGRALADSQINVDHDHSCCPGQQTCGLCLRGLLCRSCNRGLGSFGDSIELVEGALRYLSGSNVN